MIDLITDLLGTYTPLMDEYNVPYEGIASLNIDYIVTAVVFVMFIVFVLRTMLIFFKGVLNVK